MRNIKSDREKKKTSAKTKGIFNYSLMRTHKICNEISTRRRAPKWGVAGRNGDWQIAGVFANQAFVFFN